MIRSRLLLAALFCFLTLAARAQERKPPPGLPRPGDRQSSGFVDLKSAGAAFNRRVIGDPTAKKRGAARGLLSEKKSAVPAGDLFISPDESWQAAVPAAWQAQEMRQGGVDFLMLTPKGTPAQAATRIVFVLGGMMSAREAAFSDTDLLTAGLGAVAQSIAQNYGLQMTVKKPAAKSKVGARDAAAMEYSADLPGQSTPLLLWGGFARESPYCMLVAAVGRGDDYAASQQVAARLLETAKPYRAPPNPELEQALLGRWSGILSANTSTTSSRSSTVTYQFNPDRSFWRRITNSYLSTGGGGSLSGASDNFDEGSFFVCGHHAVIKLRQGGELRLRIEGQLAGGQLQRPKIAGNEVARGEI